jgi:hypothetical protein
LSEDLSVILRNAARHWEYLAQTAAPTIAIK